MTRQLLQLAVISIACCTITRAADDHFEYSILGTSKTSTMEKEMNGAAAAGFRFSQVMGGETSIGGKEVVVAMVKDLSAPKGGTRQYKLLATSKTSTMQKEMQQLADAGYEYLGQSVFESVFGGKEVVVIMENNPAAKGRSAYRLLATTKTSTMQKELQAAGEEGYLLVGLTVAKTSIGGSEVVSILRKRS